MLNRLSIDNDNDKVIIAIFPHLHLNSAQNRRYGNMEEGEDEGWEVRSQIK